MKFNHIGIFVKTLSEGREHISNVIDIKKLSQEFHDKSLKVSVQFITDKSGITYEIVAPLGAVQEALAFNYSKVIFFITPSASLPTL